MTLDEALTYLKFYVYHDIDARPAVGVVMRRLAALERVAAAAFAVDQAAYQDASAVLAGNFLVPEALICTLHDAVIGLHFGGTDLRESEGGG